ncbi:MAG: 30S ribosomal protein S3 [Candidatus Aenigmarchaeota archaeon]|nr:30S ribosomal protein S3 [Candidatus Aenigmarchaeota archaeon]
MLNKYFVELGRRQSRIEDYIRKSFPAGDYSHIELQATPLGIKIIIYTNKPGKIIGRGGRNIDSITEALKQQFKLENPQIDVKEISNPDTDAKIVAKQIKSALEKGYSYKKIGNLTVKRVLQAGAVGAEIVIAGKLGGAKSSRAKFIEGTIIHSGEYSKTLVDEGFEEAQTKPGKIGIRVRILRFALDITGKPVYSKRDEKEMKAKEEVEKLVKGLPEEGAGPKEEKV